MFESGQIVRIKHESSGFAIANKDFNHWLRIRREDLFLFEHTEGSLDGQLTKLNASNPSNAGPFILPHEYEDRFRLADLDEQ